MGRLIVLIAVVAALVYAWNKGLIQEWIGTAVDKSAESVRSTQRDATKVRPADAPPEEKK
jgi:hypothetical protein